ncbi:hypothetical protein [uncultured Sphingomonas sp.]|jgi:PBP1b-binding outer membrane lipoprotein LpoB|uniref:hypothetical protein n=1 Tax=uncultured Sphingomonas sp. TaxID=158754 RepID=UPI0025DC1E5C|nr:hypothetical protein [uncultured Sphingomonas sp.]
MRAVLSKIVAGSMIAGAALLASACSSNTETNVNNTTEVVAPENTTDASVTNVDVAAPVDNAVVDNGTMNASNAM